MFCSNRVLPSLRRTGVWREFLTGLLLATQLLLPVQAAAPSWWETRGVIIPGKASDDFAVINQGQLKYLVSAVVAEMNAKLTDGAGPSLNALVNAWTTSTAGADDFAVVNVGQLKTVTKAVYQRLLAAGTIEALPAWATDNGSDDFAVANIGQAKHLFAFEVPDQVSISNISSPFLISFQGWKSGSVRPYSFEEPVSPPNSKSYVGTIRKYKWQMGENTSEKPNRLLIQTERINLVSGSDPEIWKSNNTQTPKQYIKNKINIDFIYNDPDDTSLGLNSICIYRHVYHIDEVTPVTDSEGILLETRFGVPYPVPNSYIDAIYSNYGDVSYEVTDNSWTEADYEETEVLEGDVPPHWFKQQSNGPVTPPVAWWSAMEDVSTMDPLVKLGSPGSLIPYESMIAPATGGVLAVAEATLDKTRITYQNDQDNLVPSDRYNGHRSEGAVTISWRSELPEPLNIEQKQLWISFFNVVKKTTTIASGGVPVISSTSVPLSTYLTATSTLSQPITIGHLIPLLEAGVTQQVELSLVATSSNYPWIGGGGGGKIFFFAINVESEVFVGAIEGESKMMPGVVID